MSISEWAGRLNNLANAVGGASHLIGFDPENLLELAKSSTQLRDFGEPEWRQRYYRYCADLQSVDFSLTGLILTKSRILRALRNRLIVIDKMKREPSIGKEKILNPIFITGAARTGTSIFFELLARDPHLRAPLTWEAICPVPLKAHMTPEETSGPEIAKNERNLFVDIAPDFKRIHELGWDVPVECHELMEPSFANMKNESGDDVSSRYQWHKKILQVLQHGSNSRQWLLKCCCHLPVVDELFNVYPDAVIINIHRDPLKSISSMLHMGEISASMLYRGSDRNYFGRVEEILESFEKSRRKIIALREDSFYSERIFDIKFDDLMGNPTKTIRDLYERMGFDYKDYMDSLINDYLLKKPRNKFKSESHFSEEHGFLKEEIKSRLGFYIDYYGIPSEE